MSAVRGRSQRAGPPPDRNQPCCCVPVRAPFAGPAFLFAHGDAGHRTASGRAAQTRTPSGGRRVYARGAVARPDVPLHRLHAIARVPAGAGAEGGHPRNRALRRGPGRIRGADDAKCRNGEVRTCSVGPRPRCAHAGARAVGATGPRSRTDARPACGRAGACPRCESGVSSAALPAVRPVPSRGP